MTVSEAPAGVNKLSDVVLHRATSHEIVYLYCFKSTGRYRVSTNHKFQSTLRTNHKFRAILKRGGGGAENP